MSFRLSVQPRKVVFPVVTKADAATDSNPAGPGLVQVLVQRTVTWVGRPWVDPRPLS